MLKPTILQVPDYSAYIGKEFIITEDSDKVSSIYYRPMKKGVKFKILKIKNSNITIKITNTKKQVDELGMLDADFDRLMKTTKSSIKTFMKIIKMWEDHSDKFVIDKDSIWNKPEYGESKGGHCVNTGYSGIPFDHPDKYGMAKGYSGGKTSIINSSSIMTLDYYRTDGVMNIYSYQAGEKVFYSKTCYEFMLKGEQVDYDAYVERTSEKVKMITKWVLEKTIVKVKTLNKLKFEAV